MNSCEAAREKAEKVLEEQRKLTAIWKLRAREKGWRERIMRSQFCLLQIVQVLCFGYLWLSFVSIASAKSDRFENSILGYKKPGFSIDLPPNN
ncbi:hypothetical protein NC651_026126 [Populus alba x Populus x berolinensis]|nr:hypothetical protein NC651_026126 [Populus alba x Populus x berolinensis]